MTVTTRRRRRRCASPVAVAGLVVASLAGTAPAGAGPATPDPGFGGGDGLAVLDTSRIEVVDAVLGLADGRTLLVGTDLEASTPFVARMLADGSPDPAFGTGGSGVRVVDLGTPAVVADAVAAPGGGVLVAATVGAGSTDLAVARLTPDGVLDPAYGTGGVARVDVSGNDLATGLAVQPDGAAVVVGQTTSGAAAVVARLTPAGVPDATFGTGGVATVAFGTDTAAFDAVAVQSDGAVVAAGVVVAADVVEGSAGVAPLVVRFTPAGALDAGYGVGGRVVAAALPMTAVRAVVLQHDDRAVLVGPSLDDVATATHVTRLTTGGVVDVHFGTAGTTTVAPEPRTVLLDATVDDADHVVLSGVADRATDLPADLSIPVVVRLRASGTLDPGFGCAGTAAIEVPAAGGGSGSAVAVAADGAVVVAGVTFRATDVDIPPTDAFVLRLVHAPPTGTGAVLVRADGGTSALGDAPACGSLAGRSLTRPVVGAARTPSGGGYWLVASDGGVFAFGDAGFAGSTGAITLNRPIVGMAADPDGAGYWLVASDGGVFAFDAPFLGSTGGLALRAPIVGMAPTPSGQGYWLVASDGGVFAFGDAGFAGSTGAITLNRPIVGMAADPDGAGYWLVASDGGVFAFDAAFAGSAGAIALSRPVVGMVADPDGTGYWLVAADGGTFAYAAPFVGATTTPPFPSPVVAVAGP